MWNGPRKNVGIKVDVGLYSAFKPIAQARFGSVCCAVEGFMAGIVGAVHNSKVSMGNSVTIDGGMHVHRMGLKERRKYVVDIDVEEEEFLKKYQWHIDTWSKFYRDMGESPSLAGIEEKLDGEYALPPSATAQDRVMLRDHIFRELYPNGEDDRFNALAMSVLDLYSERGLSGLSPVYDLMREVDIPSEDQGRVRDVVVKCLGDR